jgi:hypothetical protein
MPTHIKTDTQTSPRKRARPEKTTKALIEHTRLIYIFSIRIARLCMFHQFIDANDESILIEESLIRLARLDLRASLRSRIVPGRSWERIHPPLRELILKFARMRIVEEELNPERQIQALNRLALETFDDLDPNRSFN